MRILCITYEYPPIGGGGSNVAHPLAAGLAELGHTVDVVTSGMGNLPASEVVDGVNIHRVPCIRRYPHYTTTAELVTSVWSSYRKALELCSRHQYDINHTHFALPSGLVSCMLRRKTGLPYVTTIHGSDIPGYNPDRFRTAHVVARPLWRRIMRDSSRIVSASNFLKNLANRYIDVPIDVIRNGFDSPLDADAQVPKINRILVVTRMFQRKGVQHFVNALAGFNHGWEVVVAGDGPYLPILKNEAKRCGIDIHFPGFVQGSTLATLYASAKIFVFPSLQENFPIVLLEAMNAGCAIITTSAQGCAEVVGNAGITTKPESPQEIRAALETLIGDDDKITAYRQAALDRIERFRWPQIASEYERLFREAAMETAAEDIPDLA